MKHAFCATLLAILFSSPMAFSADTPSVTKAAPTITVYKTPSCGCCQGWVDYLSRHGFTVTAHNLQNLDAVKQDAGLTDPRLASCHTAVIDGYFVEGHVPVDAIHRLLTERPAIIGLTAPGMPSMSPGMMSEQPQGYDVLSVDADGNTDVFSRY